ncbi:MAG: hypothetical protein H0V92_06400 [Pseudonocardiales bacterium]|nr:hypothetical protein [Pseudonocardiales bacterium]
MNSTPVPKRGRQHVAPSTDPARKREPGPARPKHRRRARRVAVAPPEPSLTTGEVAAILQTEEYAKAIASHGWSPLAGQSVQRQVGMRMRRQALLGQPNPPKVWAVIDESVLRRPIGGRLVVSAQTEHLLELAKRPHVTVQVVPYQFSGYAAEGSFTTLRFTEPELPDVVYIEHPTGALYLDKRFDTELYGGLFSWQCRNVGRLRLRW